MVAGLSNSPRSRGVRPAWLALLAMLAAVLAAIPGEAQASPPAGRLVIRKITIGGPPNFAYAQFTVNCTPNGPATTVTVAANGLATVNHIPTPATCTVAERPLPPQGNCHWVGTRSPAGPVAIAPGATVIVTYTNRLVCPGRLVIVKSTVFPPGVPQFLTASFNLNCNPGGHLYISGSPNGQLVYNNLPAPATCTVAEVPPPAPTGCTWTPIQTPPGSVAILPGATTTINVSNRLTCSGPGRLEIRKITNFPPGVSPFASVVFNVSCTPGGTNTTLTVPANGAAVVPYIAAPVTCSVTEQPPLAPAGCSWTPAMVVAGGASAGAIPINTGVTSVVLVTNSLVCGGSTASTTLQVRKWVMVNGATMPSPAATLPPALQTAFPVTVACGSRPPVQVSLNSANSYQDTVAASVGETCTIHETVPPFPTPGCHWSVSYPQGPSTAIALGTNEINLYNTQVCP